MKTATSFCERCGGKIYPDATQEVCPACLLERGLLLFDDEHIPGVFGPDSDNCISESNKKQCARSKKILSDFGDYELLEEIGRGGQGVVYRAHQKSLNRTVALKVIGLGPWTTETHLKRFRREAEAVAHLEHPSIVPIHEVGERDGQCYFSMSFVEGGQLDDVVEREPMPIRAAVELVAKLGRAVHYAHEHGILHRDIKPGNVLLDKNGEPHLTDFGLARLVETESTVTGTLEVLGTPSYMAPEQAAGNNTKLSNVTDVYGLGAVLYRLLTGHPPFSGTTTYETIKLLLETEPKQPRLLNPKIDRDLSTICLKCLEKDPRRRYPSAIALTEDLEHWLKHEPICAQRSGVFIRGSKWVRRNPSTAALVILSVTLVIAVGAIVWDRISAVPMPKSVAVLPFENLSHEADNAYFADGIQDEILTRLASIEELRVMSRSSTQHYRNKPRNLPEVAKQLSVANILEGNVQKSADQVRVNVQLFNAKTGSQLWAETYDRELTDIFGIESEIARAVADHLRAKLTGQAKQVIAAKPTDNVEAYDAYLRGLAYTLKAFPTRPNTLAAQRYFKEAVRLDPKFALGWALLSYVDARGYITQSLQPTAALREEARQAAEAAFTLRPNLGEAVLAKGSYYYYCLKDYDTAAGYLEQARQLLPNSAMVPELLAYVARRRGEWERSEAYFKEAQRLDPHNVSLLTQWATSYSCLRRFPEALRKFDEALNIAPDDLDILVRKAAIAQAQGDLPHASALLARLHPTPDSIDGLETRVYQAILERRPTAVIPFMQEILGKTDPTQGYFNDELRLWLGWAQELAGDYVGAVESWRQARTEMELFLKDQPDNYSLLCDLALINMSLGNKADALTFSERAIAANPVEKDAVTGLYPIEILARVAARMGEPDRAIAALRKVLSTPCSGSVALNVPLTPALLRLDPMFDPLRSDPRFQELCKDRQP